MTNKGEEELIYILNWYGVNNFSDVKRDIGILINQQVLEVLEKLKSKKLEWSVQDAEMLEHQDKSDFIAVPLSAIEQLEKEYRK